MKHDISDNPRAYRTERSCVHAGRLMVLSITSITGMAHKTNTRRSVNHQTTIGTPMTDDQYARLDAKLDVLLDGIQIIIDALEPEEDDYDGERDQTQPL